MIGGTSRWAVARALVALGWVSLMASEPAMAEPAIPAEPQVAPTCQTERAAIDAVASAVARQLPRVPAGTLVVALVLRSDGPTARPVDLAVLLARQVAGRLGPAVAAHPKPLAELSQARHAAAARPALVVVQPQISAGQLRLTADAYPVPRSVWARVRAPEPGSVGHGYAAAALDAEVRAYLPAIGFTTPSVAKFSGADPNVLALACGDLDADGAPDLAMVGRQRIVMVRLRDGRVERVRAAAWADLVPIASVPLREPLGFATIVPGALTADGSARLDVGLSDRARSVRLDATLQLLDEPQGLLVPHGRATACGRISRLLIDDELSKCRDSDPPLAMASLRQPSDALSSSSVVDSDGRVRAVVATRSEQRLVVRDAEEEVSLGGVGAQLAIGDVDQDGLLDVVSSRDVLAAAHDAMFVRTLLPSGKLTLRYSVATPQGVRALAICPPDGPDKAAIVLATGDELWVVR